MMKKLLLAGSLVIALTACCNTTKKYYYQLPVTIVTVHEQRDIPAYKQIYLVDINVSDFLNGLGIVYQVNDVQYVMANNNLWASNLHEQLQQELISNFNSQLPDWLLTTQMLNKVENRLMINVYGFHGRYDGKAIIRGEWTFTHNTQLINRMFDIELPQPEDGYDSLVRTLSKGWKQLSVDIANVISQTR